MLVLIGDLPLSSGAKISSVYKDPATLINILIKNSLVIASLILFIALIFAGVKLIIDSGDGDPKAVAANQQAATATLIGFLIVFSATLIVQLLETFTGVQIIK